MEMFRTNIAIKASETKISHYSKILLLGSCFSENIGNLLQRSRFDVVINPFGIVYNPVSIANELNFLLETKIFTSNDLNFANYRWFSFFHHGNFSNTNQEICLQNINSSLTKAADFLKQTDILLITFGTAWIFEHVLSRKIVSNCHKISDKEFHRKFLEPENIVAELLPTILKIKELNQNLKVILTVSPVRHLRDEASENQLSKSSLILAAHKMIEQTGNSWIEYFPAYEIMMDDLRDYRFYNDDMIHPSTVAIKYIFEKFAATYFSSDTSSLINEIEKINKALEHKPFNENSDEYKSFLENLKMKIETLTKSKQFVNFDEAILFIQQKLNS